RSSMALKSSMSLLLSAVVMTFFFSSRRRHTRFSRDWSSDVCSSDLQRDEFQVVQFIPLVVALPVFLSGALWPIEEMPGWLQPFEIGRASCRERVQSSGGAVPSTRT